MVCVVGHADWRCLLFVVLLFVVYCCLLGVVVRCWCVLRFFLPVVCCLLFGAWCLQPSGSVIYYCFFDIVVLFAMCRSVLVGVWCLVFGVRSCSLSVVCCLLFKVCCVVLFLAYCYCLFQASCVLIIVVCFLFLVSCSWCVVCGLLFVVCCVLFDVCCLLCVNC